MITARVLPREPHVHLEPGHDLTTKTIVTHSGKSSAHDSHTTVVKEKPGMRLARKKVIKTLPGRETTQQITARRPRTEYVPA